MEEERNKRKGIQTIGTEGIFLKTEVWSYLFKYRVLYYQLCARNMTHTYE